MTSSSLFPQLEGLDKLAHRDGVDIRPTLARVLTDLYIQRETHSPEEEQRYTELVLRLLEVVDIRTRCVVARKLGAYPSAPVAVLRRLAGDIIEVAEPVLRHSRLPVSATGGIGDGTVRQANGMAAARSTPGSDGADDAKSPCRAGPELSAASNEALDPEARNVWLGALPPRREGRIGAPDHDGRTGPSPAGANDFDRDAGLGTRFLAATSAERRQMLAHLENPVSHRFEWQLVARTPETMQRLEAAALQHRPEEFARELERTLGLGRDHAWQVIHDERGEMLLIVAKALAMPSHVLLRVLLFLNPSIGQSVERVFDLVNFYERLGVNAALRVVASLRHAAPLARKTPGYQSVLWNDEAEAGRRTGSDGTRRAVGGSLWRLTRTTNAASAEPGVTERPDRANAGRRDPRPR